MESLIIPGKKASIYLPNIGDLIVESANSPSEYKKVGIVIGVNETSESLSCIVLYDGMPTNMETLGRPFIVGKGDFELFEDVLMLSNNELFEDVLMLSNN